MKFKDYPLLLDHKHVIQEQEFKQLQELTDNTVPEERKDFIRIVKNQDDDLDVLINQLRLDTQNAVKANTNRKEELVYGAFIGIFGGLINSYAGDFGEDITFYNTNVATLASAHYSSLITGLFGDDPEYFISIDKFLKQAEKYPNIVQKNILARNFPTDGVAIGDRIKTIKGEALEVVKAILKVGIREGASAEQIAYSIDAYIAGGSKVSGVTPFQWVKDAEGLIKQSKLVSHPRGTISSNSLRIARTEINETYRQATTLLNEGYPWNGGYNWVLSPSHIGPDICDDYAASNPYKADDRPRSHPYCMCDWRVIIKS